MFDDMVNLFDLGAFSDEEKEMFRTDFTYKKQMSQFLKEARQAAKRDTCYFFPIIPKKSLSITSCYS